MSKPQKPAAVTPKSALHTKPPSAPPSISSPPSALKTSSAPQQRTKADTEAAAKQQSAKRNIIMEALLALALYHPHIGLMNFGKVVIRRDYLTIDTTRLISGGGSGHEPAFSGFVGKGMLTACIQGEVFKSPSSSEILITIRELSLRGGSNILVIIQNEPGICMNFGLAIERAKNEGIDCKVLIIKDDVDRDAVRKRGLSAIILVLKIAGAMAEAGLKVNDMMDQLSQVSKNSMSLMCPLRTCIGHYAGFCSCTTGEGNEMQTSVKKCNQVAIEEACYSFMNELKNSDVKQILDHSTPVAVLVNNLGVATRLEEQLFVNFIMRKFYEMRMTVARLYCGKYLTSIQASGFVVSVVKLTNAKLCDYLDAPTNAPSWIPASMSLLRPEQGIKLIPKSKALPVVEGATKGPKVAATYANIIQVVVQFACDALISCERQLNAMDLEGGDGDTGISMSRGAKSLKKFVARAGITSYPFTMLTEFSKIVEQSMGGTLGCLYSIFFEAGSKAFGSMKENDPLTCNDWVNALNSANAALTQYTDSKVGENTMLDPLNACAITMQTALINGALNMDALASGVSAAEEAARIRRTGRKQPDPGAYAVGLWIRALYEGIKLRV